MTGDEAVVTVGLAAGIGMVARTAESLPFAVSAPPPIHNTSITAICPNDNYVLSGTIEKFSNQPKSYHSAAVHV